MALRCEAGLVTGKCNSYTDDGSALSPDGIWNGNITSSGISTAKRVSGTAEVSMVSRGLLSKMGRREITGSLRATDPAALLRIRQAVGGSGDDDGGASDD